MVRKKVFRLSGPAVVIGFFLLVPSILGMLFSAFVVLRALAPDLVSSPTSQMSEFDAKYRSSCFTTLKQQGRFGADSFERFSVSGIEQDCECHLSEIKRATTLAEIGRAHV